MPLNLPSAKCDRRTRQPSKDHGKRDGTGSMAHATFFASLRALLLKVKGDEGKASYHLSVDG
jgi:hypothetical protein